MGHQQPPRSAERARQLDDQVADVASQRCLFVGTVKADRFSRAAGGLQLLHDKGGHILLVAGAPADCHQLHHEVDRAAEVGFWDAVSGGIFS